MENKLSKTENLDLIKKFQETGDEKIFNTFYFANQGLITGVVGRFRNIYEKDFSLFEKEDLISAASVCLFQAMKTFDPSKNIEFSTFYYNVCRHEFLHYCKFTKRHEFPFVSMDAKVKGTDDLLISDTIFDKNSDQGFFGVENKMDEQILISKLKNILTKREFSVLSENIQTDKTLQEISSQFQVSRQNVSQVYAIIRKKLQKSESFRKKFADIVGDESGRNLQKLMGITLRRKCGENENGR